MKTLTQLAASAAGALACTFIAHPARAEEAAGKWVGQLPAPVGLHLVLVVERDAQDHYTAVLRSPDQGTENIPVTTIEAAPGRLKFTVGNLGIVYDAHWYEAKKAWVGVFSQGGKEMTLDLTRSTGPDPLPDPAPHSPVLPPVEGLDGAWAGELDVGSQKLRVVLHVIHTSAGVKASFDSPDQGASALPVTRLTRDGDSVAFALDALGVSFKGALSADGGIIAGVLTRNGRDLKLDLRRRAGVTAAATPWRRPQEEAIAAASLPYRSEDVAFINPAAPSVTLAGTLTVPEGTGPFPAVVLVAGSGPNMRDEEVAGHKIFLVLADYLTRQGMAVLRYDKRGVGKSSGRFAEATTDDFASDASAAVSYLRSRPEIDRYKLGLIGHSEGGMIVPMVAARDPGVSFMVMMAAPAVPGRILVAEQERLIALAIGLPVTEADAIFARRRRVFDAIVASKDSAEAQMRVSAIEHAAKPKPPQTEMDEVVAFATSPWLRRFLAYDPAPTLKKVSVPTLALNGSLDLQVPPATNLPPIRKAMTRNADLTVFELPGLNHLFQHATTGSPVEYERIEETLAPELLNVLSAWIGKYVR